MNPAQRALLQQSIFFIQANAFEQSVLHDEYRFKFLDAQFPLTVAPGHWLFNQPINVMFSFARYHGQVICFYEVISNWNDQEKVENWIEDNFNPTFRKGLPAIGDAITFHEVIEAVKEKLPPPPKKAVSSPAEAKAEEKPAKKKPNLILVR